MLSRPRRPKKWLMTGNAPRVSDRRPNLLLSKWNHPCVDVSPTQNDVRGKLDQYGDFTFPSELIAYDLMSGTVRT